MNPEYLEVPDRSLESIYVDEHVGFQKITNVNDSIPTLVTCFDSPYTFLPITNSYVTYFTVYVSDGFSRTNSISINYYLTIFLTVVSKSCLSFGKIWWGEL